MIINSNPLKVLVLTSCNGERKYNPENIARTKDLDDIQSRNKKEEELKDYKINAIDMFISTQNKIIVDSIIYLDKSQSIIDLCYVSSGYGLLNYNDPVIPYDVNLSALSMNDLDKRSDFLRVHEEVYYKAKNYDLVFFLLGYEYLRFLKLPLDLGENTKKIFFISPSDEKVLPENYQMEIVKTGNEEASKFDITPSELKGFIFKCICLESQKETVFKNILEKDNYIENIMKRYIKKIKEPDQLQLFDF